MQHEESKTSIENGNIRLLVTGAAGGHRLMVESRIAGAWTPVLSCQPFPSRIPNAGRTGGVGEPAKIQAVRVVPVEAAESPVLEVEQITNWGRALHRFTLPAGADRVDVQVTVDVQAAAEVGSLEDRWHFLPEKKAVDTPYQGPLDFVWSQCIKRQPENLCAHWTLKSPVVMFQQGPVFAAIAANLNEVTSASLEAAPLALDLDVTSGAQPWFAYGVIPNQPALNTSRKEGHSLFLRAETPMALQPGLKLSYVYTLLVSEEPERLGYRRAVRFLWEQAGREALLRTLDLQQCTVAKELFLFQDWRKDTWERYAVKDYQAIAYGDGSCGLVTSRRFAELGSRTRPEWDGWYQFWIQSLHTAYGWRRYADEQKNTDLRQKAESVMNLTLQAPRSGGAYPIVYYHETDGNPTWRRDDPWAGYMDEYHVLHMAWNSYWTLRWMEDLTPDRKQDILPLAVELGEFLIKNQQENGCIPAWYNADGIPERTEFRTFNAEGGAPALFLVKLYEKTGDLRYLEAAQQAMAFIEREVLPRQRWADFETYISCSWKPFDFYDSQTAQYPQNNVSTITSAWAFLDLYRVTGKDSYREIGLQVLDYLLLTQSVWNHPLLEPKLVGGFTTQNTDAEWSDARQGYVAEMLLEAYNLTGKLEYLERAVAAARSGFAVAPYENWAHVGYGGGGYPSGIHWGTGTVMTAVEIMRPQLGDAYIHVERAHGVGFNACSVRNLRVDEQRIQFNLEQAEPWQAPLMIRFDGVDPEKEYALVINEKLQGTFTGRLLQQDGLLYSQR
jgi:hypothetical protein